MAESNSAVLPLHHTPKRRLPVHLDLVTLSYPRMRLLCIHDTKLQVPSKLFRFSKRNGVKGGIEPSQRCSQHRRLPLPHYHHSNRVTSNDWVFTSSFWSGSISFVANDVVTIRNHPILHTTAQLESITNLVGCNTTNYYHIKIHSVRSFAQRSDIYAVG